MSRTATKGGATLQLSGVDWTAMGEGSYRALASYRGTATGINVSGYTSTATYLSEVKKDTLESVTYAVVYEGAAIPLPPPDYFTYLLIGVGAIVVVGDTKPKTPSPAVIFLTPETIWQEDATVTYNAFTLPEKAAFSEGGNIGVLSIPSLNLAVNFNGTDGYFKNLHTLKTGDALAYETALGSRDYTITAVKMIDQNDWSGLARDTENRRTNPHGKALLFGRQRR